MIVIGADTHKRNRMLVAVDGQTGAVRGQREIPATDAGALDALRFAAGLASDACVWAIEDCRHVSARLEAALVGAGERVIRVPAAMTGQARKVSRQVGKSDPIDPRAVALAVVRDGVESFPAAFTDQQALEIRVLCDYRDQIICERTRMINRLRWHLVTMAPDLETQLGHAALRRPQIAARLTRQLARLAPSPQLGVARRLLKRIRETPARSANCWPSSPRSSTPTRRSCLTSAVAGQSPQRSSSATPPAPNGSRPRATSPDMPAPRRSRPQAATPNATACTAAVTAGLTARSTSSRSPAQRPTPKPAPTWLANTPKAKTKLEAIRCLKRHLARRIWRLLYTAETHAGPCVQINQSNPEIRNLT